MKKTNRLLAFLMVICMTCSLLMAVSCGEDPVDPTPDDPNTPDDPDTPGTNPGEDGGGNPEPVLYDYTVQVLAPDGTPVSGIQLQICQAKDGGVCYPGFQTTDGDGKVTFQRDAVGAYKVQMVKEGFPTELYLFEEISMTVGSMTIPMAKGFYFEGDSTHLVITLKPAVSE